MSSSGPIIQVVEGNVVSFQCDVLVLKYAQAWHGADLAVAKKQNFGSMWEAPYPGQFRVAKPDPTSRIPAGLLVFAGTPSLGQFNYGTVRELGKNSLEYIDEVSPDCKHLAMTMHGVNVGLDEREAFLAQLAGILEGLKNDNLLPELERISFVELRKDRVQRLNAMLAEAKLDARLARSKPIHDKVAQAGLSSSTKPHAFVAMPFTDEMEDTYTFGILGPIQDAGLLCERVDMAVFTGDILERIKTRIETASLVVADLTGANANVYLEVGFAWGRNRKTLLICKSVDDLKFDVRGQRCLVYSSIRDLHKKLQEELKALL